MDFTRHASNYKLPRGRRFDPPWAQAIPVTSSVARRRAPSRRSVRRIDPPWITAVAPPPATFPPGSILRARRALVYRSRRGRLNPIITSTSAGPAPMICQPTREAVTAYTSGAATVTYSSSSFLTVYTSTATISPYTSTTGIQPCGST